MIRRHLLIALAAVSLPACQGCDGCGAEPVQPVSDTLESAPEPVISLVNRRHAGEPLTAAAIHIDGRVALFGQSGAFAITRLLDPDADDPATSATDSPVMDAEWIGDQLAGLETEPAALVVWDGDGTLSRVPLDGTGVDLLGDAENAAVWVVLRASEGSVVQSYSLSGDAPELRVSHRIGEQPVGLWAGYDSVYAPTFLDRTVTVFSASSMSWTASVPVQARPLSLHPTPEGPTVIGANSNVVQVVSSDEHRLFEMPAPLWIAEERGTTYAFSAGDSVLRRLDAGTFEPLAANDEFGLVPDIASSSLGLVVIDAGDEPRVVILDPESLNEVVSTRAEGRPDRVVETESGALVVVSPAEGVVAGYEVGWSDGSEFAGR